jgi:hypothetical protein
MTALAETAYTRQCYRSNGVILLRALLDGLFASEPFPELFKEELDLDVEVAVDFLVLLQRTVVAEDGDGEVAVEFHGRLAHSVLEEAPAVVVLIEDLDVAGHDVEAVHAVHLLLLLQSLRQRAVLRQLVDVVQHLLLLLRQQVLQHPVDALAEHHGVVLLGVVQHTDQPVEVVVVERLRGDVLSHAGHPDGVLVLELEVVLALLVAVELLVELDGPADGLVEAQVVPALLLRLLALVSQHYLLSMVQEYSIIWLE